MKKLANFLYEIGSLRKVARAHRQSLLTDDLSDNIASHSFRVTVIAYFLAKEEKANLEKVLTMALFHDMEEARSGDHNWLHKRYVKIYEKEIRNDQLESLKGGGGLKVICDEYDKRESKESHLAKDADLLDQILLINEYTWAGNKEAMRWKRGKGGHEKMLWSETAKKLAREIDKTKPSDWWSGIWTSKRR